MLKKPFAFLIVLFFFLFLPANSFAQNPSSPSSELIENIKTKMASQVAEINGSLFIFRGKVKSVNAADKSFTISNFEKTYTVKYLSSTTYMWIKADNISKLSLNFSNVEIDDDLVVVGNLLKIENQIDAVKIFGKIFPKTIVAKIDKIQNLKLTASTISSNTPYSLDISKTEVILKISKTAKVPLDASGLQAKDLIIARGVVTSKTNNEMQPERLILIQN